MFIDARTVAPGTMVEADVCIIGGGPAGITVALELCGAGLRVCMLESGGPNVEKQPQKLAKGESVGLPYFRLHTARVRAMGGTSHRWSVERGFRARPFDDVDFKPRPGIPYSGWPFARHVLDPYYERAQRVCGLGPYAYDAEYWLDAQTRPLSLAGDDVYTTIVQFGPLGTPFPQHFPTLKSAGNMTVIHHATVRELMTVPNHAVVSRAIVARPDAETFSVSARLFVLACGGIENPRLLLLSNSTQPAGLGNQHDLVGRFFMEHMSLRSGTIVPSDPGLVAQTGMYRRHVVRGRAVEAHLRLRDEVIEREQLLNCTFFLLTRDALFASPAVRSLGVLREALNRQPLPPNLLRHGRNVVGHLGDLAALAVRRLRGSQQSTEDHLYIRTSGEQAPNPDSRVSLGTSRDHLGQPRARLAWRFTDLDARSLQRSQDILGRRLEAFGLGLVTDRLGEEDPPALPKGTWHHMGTTRMHPSPKQGVVDVHCGVHGLQNLFVAGSSVFPTSGASNPSLTLVALSLRLADHIKATLAETYAA